MLREEVKAKLNTIRDVKELIVEDPELLCGKPTIFGTRRRMAFGETGS